MPKRDRLANRAICWLPNCSGEVTFIVEQARYGEIIGFCKKHRPALTVRVTAAWEGGEA